MRFTEFDIKKVENAGFYKYSKNTKLLDEFKESGLKCAVVTEYSAKTAGYCATSLQSTIKHFNKEYKHILCICRKGSVFLINEAVDE